MNPLVSILQQQKQFQTTNDWNHYQTDLQLLKRLRSTLVHHEQDIYQALKQDLNKSPNEVFLTEYSLVLEELNYFIKKLKSYRKIHHKHDDFGIIGHRTQYVYEPFGTVLIMVPFNYPLQLSLVPLIGALAAGNSVILKLSQQTPHINQVIQTICHEVFEINRVYVIDWTLPNLYDLVYELDVDLVFFTGSERIGKQVYQHFSQKLIPVVLELGGKSPVIVDGSYDLALSAKRIIWGKLFNFGQTCVAPDYVLVKAGYQDQLITALKKEIQIQANQLTASENIAKMINQKQKDRLRNLMTPDYEVVFDYQIHENEPHFQLVNVHSDQWNSPLMHTEIFGPILPIVVYHDQKELWTILNHNPYPLATYLFSTNKTLTKQLVTHWKTGGMVINSVLLHLTKKISFGGIKNSGVGQYHNHTSYTTFAHLKPIVKVGKYEPRFMYSPHQPNDLKLAHALLFKLKKFH